MSARALRCLLGMLIVAAGGAQPAWAQVSVTDAWVRATVPGQTSSAAYFLIRSDADVGLVSVQSPVAQSCELHEMSMQQDVMRMRAVDGLRIPAHQVVALEPLHRHLMLQGLKKTLNAGDRVALTLLFADAEGKRQSVKIEAPVRDQAP